MSAFETLRQGTGLNKFRLIGIHRTSGLGWHVLASMSASGSRVFVCTCSSASRPFDIFSPAAQAQASVHFCTPPSGVSTSPHLTAAELDPIHASIAAGRSRAEIFKTINQDRRRAKQGPLKIWVHPSLKTSLACRHLV